MRKPGRVGITVGWRGGTPVSKVQGNGRDANAEDGSWTLEFRAKKAVALDETEVER